MIGYHYASYENYLKIKKKGLIPYDIDKPEIKRLGFDSIIGIWVWLKRLKGLSHSGSIIYQIATKGSVKIVLLKVIYNINDELHKDGKKILLYHNGNIGKLNYHTGKETAIIVTKRIYPKNISLISEYNFEETWR